MNHWRYPRSRLLIKSNTPYPVAPSQTFIFEWVAMVGRYSRRSLSDPDDKLIAISAIASRFGARLRISYIAGLWSYQLIDQLDWYVTEPCSRPTKYRAPSWSWASIDGHIDFYGINESSEKSKLVEILAVNVEPKNKDFEYGAIESAYLVLEGLLMPASWLLNRRCLHSVNGKWTRSPSVYKDAIEKSWDTIDPDFVVEVQCLPIFSTTHRRLSWLPPYYTGLLLVPDPLASNGYRRVGLFCWYSSNENPFPFKDAERRVMTLY